MSSNESHAKLLVHQYHHCLLSLTDAVLNVFRVTRESEGFALNAMFIDGRRDQDIYLATAIVGQGTFQRLKSLLTGLGRGLPQVYLHFCIVYDNEVQTVVLRLAGLLD